MKASLATLLALPALSLAYSSFEAPRSGFLHDVLESKSADQNYCKEHIPEHWRSQKLGELNPAKGPITEEAPAPCDVDDSDFCVIEDELDSEGVYVDLLENPERFTGYAGDSSSRVWKAIYEENCFTPVPFIDPARSKEEGGSGFAPLSSLQGGLGAGSWGDSEKKLFGSLAGPRDGGEDVCLEKRVFYRLISGASGRRGSQNDGSDVIALLKGLHASISIHICDDYLDQTTGKWAPNLECFLTRIAQHPERLQNVYFTYVVALRALSKAGPQLVEALQATSQDGGTQKATVKQLESLIQRAQECPGTFDETSMFMGASAEILKSEFKEHFRNVSRIMDCVGCDKCRLWGKLQVTGLGTALKLLFSTDTSSPLSTPPLLISRGELVSFINALHRLSESLASVEKFRILWAARDALPPSSSSSSSSSESISIPSSPPPQSTLATSSFNSKLPKNPKVNRPLTVVEAAKPPVVTLASSPSVPKSSAKSGREGEREKKGMLEWLAGVCKNGYRTCFEGLAKVGVVKARMEL
ncbi:hypothetical protein P7C70_g3691, partial [Phenoliferia sp. Uapishka_3]